MTALDYIVILVILASILISLVRGFVREILSLVSWIGAIYVANKLTSLLEPLIPNSIAHPGVRYALAFVTLVVIGVFVLSFLSRQISRLVKVGGLGGTDRALGIFFGLARGLLILAFLTLVIGVTPLVERHHWKGAYFRPLLESSLVILEWIPINFDKFTNISQENQYPLELIGD